MNSARNPGRVAGFFYLLLTIAGPIRIIYIPSKLFVHGNAAATASNIAAHELLFRLGMVSDLFVGVIVIFVALALYRLFRGVNQNLAVLMVILGGVLPSAIYFFNVLNDAAALMLVRGADFLSVFDQPRRDALAMLFLHLHGQGFVAGEVFYGLWLFPLAVLTYKSRFLPRFLGVWLVLNGSAYLVQSLTGFLLPQYENTVANIVFPALTGEVAFMLWLLVRGAKPPEPAVASAERE
ncbi:MAG TPA: DUF4386 domain-containing protein [Candidatus Angelobacter sp.]|nr:DUF4386 domain-containing protein [Candidatus Angelobacter sp.]